MSKAAVTVVLANCTNTLLEEIAHKDLKRKNIALTYALAIRAGLAGESIDWSQINKAIINRWSLSSLDWIKKRAHKLSTSNKTVTK